MKACPNLIVLLVLLGVSWSCSQEKNDTVDTALGEFESTRSAIIETLQKKRSRAALRPFVSNSFGAHLRAGGIQANFEVFTEPEAPEVFSPERILFTMQAGSKQEFRLNDGTISEIRISPPSDSNGVYPIIDFFYFKGNGGWRIYSMYDLTEGLDQGE
jgi:hypothetical protein